MKLTKNDYQSIIEQIDFLYDGEQTVEIEKDGETLEVTVTYHEDGYFEDDYYNGTGAFVSTMQELVVKSVVSFNEDGDTENDFDEDTLYKMAA